MFTVHQTLTFIHRGLAPLIVLILSIASCHQTLRQSDIQISPSEVPCHCYEVIAGERSLDSAVIRQVDGTRAFFRNGDFVFFGSDKDPLQDPYSQIENIPLDPYLVNNFLFLFTAPDSSRVLAYVIQTETVQVSIGKTISVMDADIRTVLAPGRYDIHAFHNRILVAKRHYTLLPEWMFRHH